MRLDKHWPPTALNQTSYIICNNEGSKRCFFLRLEWINRYVAYWNFLRFYGVLSLSETNNHKLSVLSIGPLKSRLKVPYRSIGFNEATEPLVQNMTVEFNDFIAVDPTADESTTDEFQQCIAQTYDLLMPINDWDEIRLSALRADYAQAAMIEAINRKLIVEVFSERLTYWVDLDQIRRQFDGDFIASRSANTRAQLRKSLRATESALGVCKIDSAQTLAQAQIWFDALGVMHAKRWNELGAIEGFNNPRFVEFHRAAIDSMWPKQLVQILRLQAGETTLAYLYNFVIDGRVYFNMSGIDYDQKYAVKPGMLAHWLSINLYIANGLRIYDFMAGTNRYKESLCTHQTQQMHLLIRRRRWYFLIESILKKLRNHYRPEVKSSYAEQS